MEHLPTTYSEIHDALHSGAGGILVHCASGVSRSASIVIAYLMREEGLSYATALESVRGIRSIVFPNSGFTQQLDWYGKNGCLTNLCEQSSAKRYYADLPMFKALLRKYTAEQIKALVAAAGVPDGVDLKDRAALERAMDALDRLQNAHPLNEEAREEKRRQCRRIEAALDKL
eukprot:gnl/MRDRNA2_/MRDRNA2_227059_c0_seq1.p1 gnl/MRDRNA2_/MRDRNA2_227059_c0~~gnl/MRDRNA2_/MRDRNA2_227059_c0_seq1.p1  ORF type:complete len:182 (-),score=34.04 gnl/MRDRNA2_/MRDRNA2_227059_c0_seq1:62-580(-)